MVLRTFEYRADYAFDFDRHFSQPTLAPWKYDTYPGTYRNIRRFLSCTWLRQAEATWKTNPLPVLSFEQRHRPNAPSLERGQDVLCCDDLRR